jgi:hypothetical protein
MIDYYILVGQTPVPCDIMTWAVWFENGENRVVLRTRILDVVEVSTVFLGLDHGFSGDGPPILFETMAFWLGPGGRDGYEQERCSTWLEAEAMHRAMCRDVMRPAAVAAACWRFLRGWWSGAREDWRIGWKELRGLKLDTWEELALRMRAVEP